MLIIRFLITCAIPDIPGWLAAEMAKIEYARREASRVKNTTPSPEEITSKLIGRYFITIVNSIDGSISSSISDFLCLPVIV